MRWSRGWLAKERGNGYCIPQLVFSGWSLVQGDDFTTTQVLWGGGGNRENALNALASLPCCFKPGFVVSPVGLEEMACSLQCIELWKQKWIKTRSVIG